MISNNRSYGEKLIKELKEFDNNIDNSNVSEDSNNQNSSKNLPLALFYENFTTNFSLITILIRNKTKFARNDGGDKLNPLEIVKDIIFMESEIFNMSDIYVDEFITSKVHTLVKEIVPFINLIPFLSSILKSLEGFIIKKMLFLIRSLYRSIKPSEVDAIDNFNDFNDFNDFYTFDYESIINNPNFVKEEKVDGEEFVVEMEKIKKIEEEYNKVNEGNSFDFNAFDSMDNFYHNDFFDIFRLEEKGDKNDFTYMDKIGIAGFDIEEEGNLLI